MEKLNWPLVVEEFAASGLSGASFCRERGISDSALSYWRKKLGSEPKLPERFARVESGDLVAIELPGGKTIRMRRADLPALIDALCGR